MTSSNNGHILCTGGAGYIGSHTVLKLLENGFDVTIVDGFLNSDVEIISRLENISNKKIKLIKCNMLDKDEMMKIISSNNFDGVIHFAALKSVGESVSCPLKYYRNNLVACLNLLDAMHSKGLKKIVFSSSATVYKYKENNEKIKEDDELQPCNPYGQTKLYMEQILQDLYLSDPTWSISILRYFNPIGAHKSGLIGESPEQPMNLLPYIQQVAVGRKPCLNIFGNDWNTADGTGVRDYLHVEDLAEGHVAALKALNNNNNSQHSGCDVYNLGTGKGVSVLEMVAAFEKASGKKIPVNFVERRPGDLAYVVADVSKAEKELNWRTSKSLDDACNDAWKWQSNNPYGFKK